MTHLACRLDLNGAKKAQLPNLEHFDKIFREDEFQSPAGSINYKGSIFGNQT